MNIRFFTAIALAIVCCSVSPAALILTQVDGPTPVTYANGGGTGFGGMLSNGNFTFDRVVNNIEITFTPGSALGNPDRPVLYLDTRPGGFTDATMNDPLTSDWSRNAISNLGSFGNEIFPTNPAVLPDFAIAYRPGGCELFELTASPNSLNFISSGTMSGSTCKITVAYATLGSPPFIDFFAALVNGQNGFLSNESHPFSPGLNGGGNPGMSAIGRYDNHNRFVPEPAAFGFATFLLGVAVLIVHRRYRLAAWG